MQAHRLRRRRRRAAPPCPARCAPVPTSTRPRRRPPPHGRRRPRSGHAASGRSPATSATRPSPAMALDRIAGSSAACSWARTHQSRGRVHVVHGERHRGGRQRGPAVHDHGELPAALEDVLGEAAAVVVVAAQPPVEPQLPRHPGRRLHVPHGQRTLGRGGEVGVLEVDAGQGRDLAAVAIARAVLLGDGEVVGGVGPRGRAPTHPTPGAGRGRTAPPAPAAAAGRCLPRRPGSARPGPRGWPRRRRCGRRPGPRPPPGRPGLVPPTKMPIRRSSLRPDSSSRPWLQSRVARMVRWRGGRSRGPASSALSSLASRECGSRSRVRAAASSSASGRPASRSQVAATAAASAGSSPHPGLTRPARSSSSRAAGEGEPSGNAVHRQRLDGVLRLPAHPQRGATGREHGEVGHGLDQGGHLRCDREQVLDVVEDEQQVLPAQPLDHVVGHRRAGSRVASTASAIAGSTWPGSSSGASSTSTTPSA